MKNIHNNSHEQKKTLKHTQSGFTLVELAIVMIIVGLLIGGVLKGQELIANAKTTATIAQVKGFQTAMLTFRDTYGSLPGDMANATTRIQGCGPDNDAAGNFCQNGNGNGIVGGTGNPADLGIISSWALGAVSVNSEPAQFFKHLALANLITGINPATNTLAWGELYPASSLRGGYTITHTDCQSPGTCNHSPGGLVLRLHNSLTAVNIEMPAGAASASSLEAGRIDQKLDDGIPNRGWVRSLGQGVVPHCESAYTGSTAKDCTMAFRIDG